jgi:peptide deformylase
MGLAVLKIIEWPEKVLLTKAEDVKDFDQSLVRFVADMHETMASSGGIGLAANQVAVLKRVIVINIPWENRYSDQEEEKGEEQKWWHNKPFTIINPKITKKNGKTRYMEGCLSFPEMYDFVERADVITVSFFDELGKQHEIEADGLFSICLQHEIDHLDGIVFVDRMSRLKASTIKKKMMKRAQLRPTMELEESNTSV